MQTSSKISTLFEPLRVRFAEADHAELEQALLRVVIAAMIVGYVAWVASPKDSTSAVAVLFVWAFFGVSLAFVLAIWFWPAKSATRRILGIVGDVGVATWGLWALGEGGVVIVGLYLFIILGNGLRYGRLYLHLSQVLSIVGFTFVALSSSWWSEQRAIWLGLMITIITLPFYVSKLTAQLEARLFGAQRELEECRRQASEQSGEASSG